jgi:hypothetical protein
MYVCVNQKSNLFYQDNYYNMITKLIPINLNANEYFNKNKKFNYI